MFVAIESKLDKHKQQDYIFLACQCIDKGLTFRLANLHLDYVNMKLLLIQGRLIHSLVINPYLLFIQNLQNLQSRDVSFSNYFQFSVIGLNQDYPYIL